MTRAFIAALAVGILASGAAAVPVTAASVASGAGKPPDRLLRVEVNRGPKASPPAARAALPLRRGGPFDSAKTPAGPGPSPTPAAAAGPKTALAGPTLNQQGLVASQLTPSDSTGSIGPVHYLETTNEQIGMYDRTLTQISAVPLVTFLATPAGMSAGDPQIQWDQQAGRWEYAALEFSNTDDKLAFGWSKAADSSAQTLSNADWCNFHIDTGTSLDDFPKLGHDSNFLLIGANVFPNNSQTFANSVVLAEPQPGAGDTSCTAPPPAAQFSLGRVFTPVPSNLTDSSSTAYVVATGTGAIGAWHLTTASVCTGGPPCIVFDGAIPITPWSQAPPNQDFQVPQPGGNPAIDAIDGRLTQAVQHSDPTAANAEAVWTQHTTGGPGGRTVVTWFELMPGLCSGGFCSTAARHQEGTLADPSLYLFNAAISPTSRGDSAVIQYNTGSANAFAGVRARSRDGADPLNSMSGELTLRGSSVPDTDFSCAGPFGPPCRWGDYSGASPDPTSCSAVWATNMLNGDSGSVGGRPSWVTQNFAIENGSVRSASSTQQYQQAGSDGQTWVDVDTLKLRVGVTPCADTNALISGNADLWTDTAGINQDIGLFVDVDGALSTNPVAWKESGGSNGTFSPNAAYAQGTFAMPAGHSYTVRLKWKAHRSTTGAIYAGAGPLPDGTFSPTRLTVQLFANAPPVTRITIQAKNTGSDGATWVPVPGLAPLSFAPSSDARALLGGNADLWTDTAGLNQDLGIMLTGGTFGSGTVIAWKESGGLNGTFSPNAAFVEAPANLTGGQSYTAVLVWKTNHAAPQTASIYAGAGPLGGAFSPTSLVAVLFASGSNPAESVITTQPSLANSNGTTWSPLGVQLTVNPLATINAVVTANADLWTANAGFNQDLAVFVSDNGATPQLLVWKESGGSGGTFSPNAALVETVYPLTLGHTYVFSLRWKTNRSSGASIFAGAGPISGAYSPTRLVVAQVS